ENRLAAIEQLARKHRVAAEELPALAIRLREELDNLEHSEERTAELEARLAALEKGYREAAEQLSKRRRETAARLAKGVTEVMQELGMPGDRVEFAVDADARARSRALAMDQVEALPSATPGHPPAPLARVASGGGLSRISLAVQVIAS